MRELFCFGISHKTAPLALRERVALLTRDAEALCLRLVELPAVAEAVAVSTCNRTEVYLAGDPEQAEPALLSALAPGDGDDREALLAAAFRLRDEAAARHLFEVAAGLDSMIVGESEIQGQVKRAHEAALAAGTAGPLTTELFSSALRTGRRVRSETRIAAGHASVSSVAVALAAEVVGDLRQRKVLIVGAGETAELTARALSDRGVSSLVVTNRHAHRARMIASRFGGSVAALHDLPEHLGDADIVVSSTASPHTIVGADELAEIAGRRGGRPLVLIDLAVPRDVDPRCADVAGVSVYDMDDLERRAAETLRVREEERLAAEAIVDEELRRFCGTAACRDADALIGELRRHADAIVEMVLAENAARWESASPRDRARVEALARSLVQRLLHEPTIRLKALEHDGDPAGRQLAAIAEMFGLAGPGDEPAAAERPANVLPLRRA